MSHEKMILTPYEPTSVLNDYSNNDQQNDRISTASYEDGDVSSVLSKNNTLSQNDKPKCQFCSKVYANKKLNYI